MNSKVLKTLNKAHQSKEEMLRILENTDTELLNFKPDAQNWNMIQVAEHCKNIESSVLLMLNKYKDYPSRPSGLKEGLNALILKLALKSGFRYKVPPIKNLVPEGKSSLKEIKNEWNDVRSDLVKYLEAFPDDKLNYNIFKHPSAGFLNLVNTVDFIHYHTTHHLIQIDRLHKAYNDMNRN